MKGEHTAQFARRLDDAVQVSAGIITPTMKDVLARVAAGKAPFSYHTWRVICFGTWLKTFGVQL